MRQALAAVLASRWRWRKERAGRQRAATGPAAGRGSRAVPRRAGRPGAARAALPPPRRRPELRPARGRRPALPLSWLAVRRAAAAAWSSRASRPAAPSTSESATRPIRATRPAGLIFAYIGPGEPPLLPALRVPRRRRPSTLRRHKTLHECNYLQGNEGNIDPQHLSFLHHACKRRASARCTRRRHPPAESLSAATWPTIEVEETDFGVRHLHGAPDGRRSASSCAVATSSCRT